MANGVLDHDLRNIRHAGSSTVAWLFVCVILVLCSSHAFVFLNQPCEHRVVVSPLHFQVAIRPCVCLGTWRVCGANVCVSLMSCVCGSGVCVSVTLFFEPAVRASSLLFCHPTPHVKVAGGPRSTAVMLSDRASVEQIFGLTKFR